MMTFKELENKVTDLTLKLELALKEISILKNKIKGEGTVNLSKNELKVDRSTSMSEILNFRDKVNSIIDLSVPGDGKFLRALNGKYTGSLLSMSDILAGSLTQGYVPYFNTTAWANSYIFIGVNKVGIKTVSPVETLDVYGSINIRSGYNLTWGGAYGVGIPTIAATSGADPSIGIYPAGSTSGVKFVLDKDGNLTIKTLAGTGTRNVVADANGVLSAP